MMALAALSGVRPATTRTFTGNETFVVPAGVTNLIQVTGKGQNGTSSSTKSESAPVVVVSYQPSGSGSSGSVNWSNYSSYATSVRNSINGGGNVNYDYFVARVYPNGTNELETFPYMLVNIIAGTAVLVTSGGWQNSGPITSSGAASVSYSYVSPGASGASAAAFGLTFPGGSIGAAAIPVTFSNVAVTPGGFYSVEVPPGGSITISY